MAVTIKAPATALDAPRNSGISASLTRVTDSMRSGWFAAPVGLGLRLWVALQMLDGTLPRLFGTERHVWLNGQEIREWLGPLEKDHAYFSAPTGVFVRFVIAHSVAFAILLVAAELAIGLGVATGTLLRVAASGGLCLMILDAMAGFGGVTGEYAGAFVGILFLGSAAGLIGADGLIRCSRGRRS